MTDERRHLPGRNGEGHIVEDRFVRHISERNAFERNSAFLDDKLGLSWWLVLERGCVNQFIHHPNANGRARELELDTREAAARIGAHQQRGQEGEELSRALAVIKASPAGIKNYRGNSASADRFHERIDARLNTQHLARSFLDRVNRSEHPCSHLIFELKRFDDQRSLADFARDLNNSAHRLNFATRRFFYALNHFSGRYSHNGTADQSNRRHRRIEHNHRANETDDRKEVAAEIQRHHVQHVANSGGVVRYSGNEIARAVGLKKRDIDLEQMVEHAFLSLRDEAIADLSENDL